MGITSRSVAALVRREFRRFPPKWTARTVKQIRLNRFCCKWLRESVWYVSYEMIAFCGLSWKVFPSNGLPEPKTILNIPQQFKMQIKLNWLFLNCEKGMATCHSGSESFHRWNDFTKIVSVGRQNSSSWNRIPQKVWLSESQFSLCQSNDFWIVLILKFWTKSLGAHRLLESGLNLAGGENKEIFEDFEWASYPHSRGLSELRINLNFKQAKWIILSE